MMDTVMKSKKVVKSKSNTRENENKKSRQPERIIPFSANSWANFPEKESWRLRLIDAMQEWVKEESSYEPMQFFVTQNIPRKTFYEWCQKYPELNEAFEEIKLQLGMKRRLAATFNKNNVNDKMILRDLHRYDKEEHDNNMYHSEMKIDENKQSHTFVIEMGKPQVQSKEALKIEVDETKE